MQNQNYNSQLMRLILVVMIILQISIWAKAASHCQAPFTPPSEYLKIQTEIEQKIRDFSNLPAFAKKADEMLSKLITAKSPVIISWVSKRNLQSKSEEEVIREWRKYFALNFIIAKYPYNDTQTDLPIDFLFTAINKLVVKNEFQQKMQTLFTKSQTTSIETIKKYKLEKSLETQITSRISNIKLYWASSLKDSKFKNQALEFFDWGIAYDPVANEINIGTHALAYPNEETYLAVFAHEIAHSFDSCRWGAYFTGKWPFEKVASCLRSDAGAGAKIRDDSKLDELIKAGKLPADLGQALKLNPTCNKIIYPPEGLQADQLPETFADWFSAETMAQLHLASTANLRADLCEPKPLNQGSSYLSNQDRLDKIYFANPILKSALANKNLQPAFKYCSFL